MEFDITTPNKSILVDKSMKALCTTFLNEYNRHVENKSKKQTLSGLIEAACNELKLEAISYDPCFNVICLDVINGDGIFVNNDAAPNEISKVKISSLSESYLNRVVHNLSKEWVGELNDHSKFRFRINDSIRSRSAVLFGNIFSYLLNSKLLGWTAFTEFTGYKIGKMVKHGAYYKMGDVLYFKCATMHFNYCLDQYSDNPKVVIYEVIIDVRRKSFNYRIVGSGSARYLKREYKDYSNDEISLECEIVHKRSRDDDLSL